MNHVRLPIGGTIIIVVELDEKEDPVTSIGQSTTDDLFPEIKLKWQLENMNSNAYLLEILSTCVHPIYCLRNVV